MDRKNKIEDKQKLRELAEEIRLAHMGLEVTHNLLVKLYKELEVMLEE